MGSKLFVGGLSWNTTDASLRTAFESFGQIREARVILDRETGKSRGFGFVTFINNDDAASAIRSMNGAMVDGRTIRVNEAEERRPGGGGGGGDRGGPGGDRRGPPRRDDRGPSPEVHTRGRPPFRGGDDRGPRPGGGGGWSPSGPSFRPPPPPQPGEGDWGEDRSKRTERRPKKKPAVPGTAAWDEEMRMRAGPKREKRESGRSWRDYAVDEDDESAPDAPDSEDGVAPGAAVVDGDDAEGDGADSADGAEGGGEE